MKILQIIHSVNPKGGGVIEGILRVSAHQVNDGHEVVVASLDVPEAPWLHDFPLTVIPLGEKTSSYGYSAKFIPWLQKNVRSFEAVVVNGIWQYGSLGTWRALSPLGIPYFVFPHGMLDPWFKRRYPLKHLKKWLYWPWAEYRVLRDARAVFFSNPTERELARKSFWLYRCREALAGYGVSWPEGDPICQKNAFLNAFPELGEHRLLLFLSRIHEKKGPDLAIQAFGKMQRTMPERMGHYRLVMAGPAASEAYLCSLHELSKKECLPGTVCWTGMLTVEQKWGAMRSADAYLLPSHQENYGLAVAEALSCGLPALISEEVNVWKEVIGDGAGLAEPDNVDGICRLIERWLDLPEEQRGAMRHAAVRCFEDRYEASQRAAQMIVAFQDHGIIEQESIISPQDSFSAW